MDVARILLLIRIRGLTDRRGRVLVSDEDTGVVAGSDLLLVFDQGWILGHSEGVEGTDLEEKDGEYPIEAHILNLGMMGKQNCV